MYIEPSDLSWVGAASDVDVVAKLIAKAEVRLAALVAARGGDLAVLAAIPTRLPLIQDVLENAVARVLRNPEGLRSESEGEYSYTLNTLDAAGNIWFTAEDVSLVLGSTVTAVRTLSIGLTPTMAPARRSWPYDDTYVGYSR